ncbi:type II toxin-antitoxin system death-on-curing family toxin [Cesiribacter sp. SM1]|uniref:type II toxin-antitoxin system death-on-curing family toxin n=1 Tax=Cesiribacter sp. SM1 TaxID=2861196 RepID=UPI001CD39444|nr:type II toxin-antitoxin system death-on-curing family toxin [Cesiribacter sp. SM1]
MIEWEELVYLHEMLNERFFGDTGIRDERGLEAALARPLASFGGQDLYEGRLEKAAALTESLVKNHPFHEGNIRTAYVVMKLLLLEAGMQIDATEEERHSLMLDIATSQAGYEQIVEWLRLHLVK